MKIQTRSVGPARASIRRLSAGIAIAALVGCQSLPTQTSDANVNAMSASLNGTGARSAEPGCKRLGGNSNAENAAIGATAGGILGGIIGSKTAHSSSTGARNGALIGVIGGAIAGSQYNRLIGVSEQPDGSVKMNIPGAVMFRSGSAEISPEFGATLASVGGTVREYCGLSATVIGHTDNVGGLELNQRLSVERAQAVVAYLTRQGVRGDHLRAEGHGMSEPVASNASDAGRAQNRRVEIFVRPGAQ